MSERTYTAKLKNRTFTITSGDLRIFQKMYVTTSELSARMSDLFLFDMYILDAEFGVSPHEILNAVREIEHGELPFGVKPATQFKNIPLKGLWHKHYFSAQFLINNIILGLGKTGAEKIAKEVLDPAKSPVVTPDMVNEFARRIAQEPARTRSSRKKLTGEWIIYLRHEEKNYYLCCNSHDTPDQFIYDRIIENCVHDFPNLPAWLKAGQLN